MFFPFFYFWRFIALEIISEMWHFDQFFYFSICSYIMPQLVCFENTGRFHQSVDHTNNSRCWMRESSSGFVGVQFIWSVVRSVLWACLHHWVRHLRFFCKAVITQLLVSCGNEEFGDGDLGKQTRLIVWWLLHANLAEILEEIILGRYQDCSQSFHRFLLM